MLLAYDVRRYVAAVLLPFLSHRSRHRPDLHSFPTRRSSDLPARRPTNDRSCRAREGNPMLDRAKAKTDVDGLLKTGLRNRSEEHTSELQSRFDLVCRLLLEKKKTLRC